MVSGKVSMDNGETYAIYGVPSGVAGLIITHTVGSGPNPDGKRWYTVTHHGSGMAVGVRSWADLDSARAAAKAVADLARWTEPAEVIRAIPNIRAIIEAAMDAVDGGREL